MIDEPKKKDKNPRMNPSPTYLMDLVETKKRSAKKALV